MFPKPHAWYYRTAWASLFPSDAAGRPAITAFNVSRILDLPGQFNPAGTNGSFQVNTMSSSPYMELFADGKSQGVQAADPATLVSWTVPPCRPQNASTCNLPIVADVQCRGLSNVESATTTNACRQACCQTATCTVWQFSNEQKHGCWIGQYVPSQCYNGSSGDPWIGEATAVPRVAASCQNLTVVGRTERHSSAAVDSSHTMLLPRNATATNLQVVVDVPSPSTGTGNRVLLDGRDVALLRVSLASADHQLVTTEIHTVTWRVVSGPARIWAVANGNQSSHDPVNVSSIPTYYGLARAVVQVTLDCVSEGRTLAAEVDTDIGGRTTIAASCPQPLPPIVVEASAPGLGATQVSVNTSASVAADGVLALALQSVPLDSFSYFDDFVG